MKPITEKDLKKIEEAAFQVACEQIYNDSSITGLLKKLDFKNSVNLINGQLNNIKYCGPVQKLFSDLQKLIEYVETEKIIYKNATYSDGSEIVPEGSHRAVLIDIREDREEFPLEKIKLLFAFCNLFENKTVFLTYKIQKPSLENIINLALCVDKVFDVIVKTYKDKSIIDSYSHTHIEYGKPIEYIRSITGEVVAYFKDGKLINVKD